MLLGESYAYFADFNTERCGWRPECAAERPSSGTTLAFAAFLNRRAGHRAIGAEHAAIAWQRLELLSATSADIKELAGIGRHWLGRLKAALRAGQNGFQLHRFFRDSSFDQVGFPLP
jgi:hypothetical protein